MQLAELERAIRAAIQSNPSQPAFAAVAGVGQIGLPLPTEFDGAVKTLTARGQKPTGKASILRMAQEMWM